MDTKVDIFISYSHQNPFEATTLTRELARFGYECWIDFEGIVGGDIWRESIEQALENTLAVVVILTPETIGSKWVQYEVEQAKKYGHTIIPVLFRQFQLPDFLEAYQYIDFTRGPDYEALLRAIGIAVTRRIHYLKHKLSTLDSSPPPIATKFYDPAAVIAPPAESPRLERPDGTMRAESLFYIERQGDKTLRRELSGHGATIVIKAPRQVGKSSMLIHGIRAAKDASKEVVLLDFQSLDILDNAEAFYQEFCTAIGDKLGLDNQIDQVWKSGRSNTRACTMYVEKHILNKLDAPLVLGIDETDRMFDCPFRSDFFGMLRSWHNSRSVPGSAWQRLDMVLVISTEPYMLIENSAQSPFNVGEIIQLEDFSIADVEMLNERHGNPFSPGELKGLYDLLSGHPFLVRQALYRVAIHEITPNDILDESVYTQGNGGIFADHLRRYLSYFKEQSRLRQIMIGIIDGKVVPSEDDFQRLHGAGLIRLYPNQTIYPRCKLYYLFFGKKLRG